MKVLHYISSTGMGRGEVYVDLVNKLAKSIDVVLLIPKNSLYLERINPSVEVIEYNAYDSRISPLLLWEVYRKIKKIQPDIVHTHFVKASQIFNLLNRFLHILHIATKHNPRKGVIFNQLPHVIAVSNVVKESIQNNNVKVIYNGIEEEQNISPFSKNDTFTILAIGRLDKVKGFDILIQECVKLDFEFNLEIVGEGEERSRLEEKINVLKLADKVKLLGFKEDIPQRIANTDLVVISSHSEGFGMIMIESLFYAKMLISTRVGVAEEILPKQFLIEGYDIAAKITEVYNNSDAYQNAFDSLKNSMKKHFLLTNIADEHIAYYQKVLKERE